MTGRVIIQVGDICLNGIEEQKVQKDKTLKFPGEKEKYYQIRRFNRLPQEIQ